MVVNSNPVAGLQKLGLSEYEARAYAQLLRNNPVTAYELSRESGIPSSKIYEVLGRLVDKGAAMPLEEDGKQRFVPLAPRELLANHRFRLEQELDDLEQTLRLEARDPRYSYIWNIRSLGDLMAQTRRLVLDTRKELVLSVWPEEADQLRADLRDLEERGIKVAAVYFGEGSPGCRQAYHHPIEDTLYTERGGRSLTVVSDGERALIATIYPGNRVEGAWSLNQGFVTLAEEYLKHDIYLMKIVQRMDRQLQDHFGAGYALLRDIFANRSVE